MSSTRFQQNVFIWVSSGDVEDFVTQSRSTAMGPGLVPLTCLRSHVLSVWHGNPTQVFPSEHNSLGPGWSRAGERPLVSREEQGWALPPTAREVSPPGSHMKGLCPFLQLSCSYKLPAPPSIFTPLLLPLPLFCSPTQHHAAPSSFRARTVLICLWR